MEIEKGIILKILLKHLLIGASVTILVFWLMNEIPNKDYMLSRIHIWLAIPLGLVIATWLSSKPIYIRILKQNNNRFLVAFGFIFFCWLVAFLSAAFSEGIFGTIQNKRFEIFNALIGYGIYRLWLYCLIGLVHGLTGGLFLAMDFRKLNNE